MCYWGTGNSVPLRSIGHRCFLRHWLMVVFRSLMWLGKGVLFRQKPGSTSFCCGWPHPAHSTLMWYTSWWNFPSECQVTIRSDTEASRVLTSWCTFYSFVLSLHMCVCVGVFVSVCAWRPEVRVCCLPLWFAIIVFWDSISHWTWNWTTSAILASQGDPSVLLPPLTQCEGYRQQLPCVAYICVLSSWTQAIWLEKNGII